jgi:hypothetical protein
VSDQEFQQRYKMTKAEARANLKKKNESRGFRGVGGARSRENDENDKIDAVLRQQDQQRRHYEQTGKFWIKRKDTQQHISDEFVGKAAANAAALDMLKQQPELRGNIVITAYGPGESQGVAEGVPQPGPSSGAPKQFGSDAKIQTRQMTVKDIISSVPGVPYYNNVVDDWDAKDYSWGVTKKVIEYATYLKDHPESLAKLPPAIVLNGKFEDGAHRVSAIWLLQQRMDPKNPLWKNAKLNVQFVKQGVAEGLSPQQKQAHQANIDAAQREMDRREAEGEDMTGATIDKKTYKIIKPKQPRVDESIVVLPPNFPDDMPEEEQRAAWRKWLRNETNKAVAAQTDIQQLANKLRKQQQEKRNRGESDSMSEAADRSEMDTPEFQHALASLKKKAQQGPMKTVYDPRTKKYRNVPVDQKSQPVEESADYTYEDILSKLKTRLGDYLSDVAQAVKDTDLSDKPKSTANTVNAVKTVMTDDGHEIRIHGNEDDGFRITIKNKDSKSKFASLKEAEMAANLYCAKRRQTPVLQAPDYMSEENKDACYHKVKSRYKVWPSAYASGALVQCRKKGAKNWGNK